MSSDMKKPEKSIEKNNKTGTSKKEKNTKERARTFIVSLLILIIPITIALFIPIVMSFLTVKKNIENTYQSDIDHNLRLYSSLVNARIALLQSDITNATNLIENDLSLHDMSDTSILAIEKIIKKHLANSINVQVFLQGNYILDKESYPPLNFSIQKQLLIAESQSNNFPEFHRHSQGNFIAIANSIHNPTNNDVYYNLLVTYPATILTDGISLKDSQNSFINIVQNFEKGGEESIYKKGNVILNKNNQTITTLHPRWRIEYNAKNTLLDKLIQTLSISFIISMILIFLAIFLELRRLKTHIHNDINLILTFIKKTQKDVFKNGKFKIGMFDDLYTELALYYKKQETLQKNQIAKQKNSMQAVDKKNEKSDAEAGSDDDLFSNDSYKKDNSISKDTKNKIDSSIFRAYDIRGIVGETLNTYVIKKIGQSIGSMALAQGERTVAIARDGRLSGPELIKALSEGILASGANVIDCGMVPTPVLYFACKTLDTQSGVMLTGSHNPSNHNGLKIVINGTTLAQDAIQELRENITSNNLSEGKGLLTKENVLPAYVEAIENDIILAQSLNIVIDCGNGVAGVIAEKLFTQIGCEVTPLYTKVDGNFPNHHPDPSQPANLEDLIAKVKETKAHLGLAFDGDGDRVGLVSNTGKIIWADRLMMLFAKDVLSRSPGSDIIFDVKCSGTLADSIRHEGGRPLMWKTGHSLIKAKLKETNAPLAGEMSGHIFFNDRWYGFDDGLYSAARLIEILATDSKSCDEVFAELPEMISTPEINIAVEDTAKFDLINILSLKGDFGDGSICDIDGIRVDYKDGWGLVRASNTTANLVTRFEANTEERLEEIKTLFKEQILSIQNDLEIPF